MFPAKFRAAGTALSTHFFSGVLDISQFISNVSVAFSAHLNPPLQLS
jgi:hypothetical protein